MSRERPKSAMAALLDATLDSPIPASKEQKPSSDDHNISEQKRPDRDEKKSLDDQLEKMSLMEETVLLKVKPRDCILWRFADRPSDELGDVDALAQSLKSHGQQEPILIRKNTQKTRHKYEVIFGNRRWRAADLAGIELDALYKDVSDQQAALCQKEENENRKELSDYARALSYRSQIDAGIFKSESELSRFLGISRQTLNDIMAYSRVPEVLRSAISHYRNLPRAMVSKMASLAKDKNALEVLIHLAPKISDQTIVSKNLEQSIKQYLTPSRKDVVRHYSKQDQFGNVIYKIKPQRSGAISIMIDKLAAQDVDPKKLNDLLEDILKKSRVPGGNDKA